MSVECASHLEGLFADVASEEEFVVEKLPHRVVAEAEQVAVEVLEVEQLDVFHQRFVLS